MTGSPLIRGWSVVLVGAVLCAACGSSDTSDQPASSATTANEVVIDDAETPAADAHQVTSDGEGTDDALLEPQFGGEFNYGLVNDGAGFSTTAAMHPGALHIASAVADPLIAVASDGGWTPNLAESLTPNEDFTIWTMTLRPDVTFHDGEPVDAAAVVANLEAFRTSAIVGTSFAAVAESVVIDGLTVETRMSSPWASFPYILANQPGFMVSPATIGVNDQFVSTGPFMLEEWVPGDRVRVVRNENYWRDGLPYLDAINFKFVPDVTARRQAFDAGDLDGFASPEDYMILDFLDDDDIDVWIGEADSNEYLFILNTTVAPTNDLRVRRALAYAIDRDLIIENLRSGLTQKASSPLPPGSLYHADTTYPDYDPELAASLIDEYESEVGPVEFSVKLEPSPSTREVVEVVVSFWEDAGADVEIVEIAGGQSAITAITDDFQAISWFQFGPPDPDGLYQFFHSGGGILNWSNLESASIDDALDEGRISQDLATRQAAYAAFQHALAEEMPMIWIDHLSGVEGVVFHSTAHGVGPVLDLDGVEIYGLTNGPFLAWGPVWVEQ